MLGASMRQACEGRVGGPPRGRPHLQLEQLLVKVVDRGLLDACVHIRLARQGLARRGGRVVQRPPEAAAKGEAARDADRAQRVQAVRVLHHRQLRRHGRARQRPQLVLRRVPPQAFPGTCWEGSRSVQSASRAQVGRAHLEANPGDDAQDLLDQRRRRPAALHKLLCAARRSLLRGAAARHTLASEHRKLEPSTAQRLLAGAWGCLPARLYASSGSMRVFSILPVVDVMEQRRKLHYLV